MSEQRNEKLEAALWYASMDWRVFPLHWVRDNNLCSCSPNCPERDRGKHPQLRMGRNFCESTSDVARIMEWWKVWPSANVAVVAGLSGVDILDVDDMEGFQQALEANGPLPKTVEARSGKGGAHVYFKTDERAPNKTKPVPWADVRAHGGYVVAPPSRSFFGAYSWVHAPGTVEIAPWPEWLLALIQRRTEQTPKKPRKPKSTISPKPHVDYVLYDAENATRLPPRSFHDGQEEMRKLYDGCELLRHWFAFQENATEGKRLNSDYWFNGAALIKKVGGQDEIERLDRKVMRDEFSEITFRRMLGHARGATTCLTLARSAGACHLGCGSGKSPCGFREPGSSPIRHLDFKTEPLRAEATLSRDEVRDRIREDIRKFLTGHSLTHLIAHEPGTGKTFALNEIIREMHDVRFAYVAPTYELLHQQESDLKALDVDVWIRPQINERTCIEGRYSEIRGVYGRGLDPVPIICGGCRSRSQCEAHDWTHGDEARVVLYTSAMLREEGFIEKLAGRVVVLDEDATQYIAPIEQFNESDLKDVAELYERARDDAHGDARRVLEGYVQAVRALGALLHGSDPISEVHASAVPSVPAIPKENWKDVNDLLWKARFGRLDRQPLGFVNARLEFFARFFRLAASNGAGRRVGIVDRGHVRNGTKEPKLSIFYRNSFPLGMKILILDGTGESSHYETILCRLVTETRGYVSHDSTVIQFIDEAYSTTKMRQKETVLRLVETITALIQRHQTKTPGDPVGLVTYKEPESDDQSHFREPLLTHLPSVEYFNFWNSRGSNGFENVRLGIVAGTPRVPIEKIRAAAALYYDAPVEKLAEVWNSQRTHYRGKPLHHYGFEDGPLRTAYRYLVEKPLIQALGRFRVALGGRTVYILTNEFIDHPLIHADFATRELVDRPLPALRGNAADNRRKLLEAAWSLVQSNQGVNMTRLEELTGISTNTIKTKHWNAMLDHFNLKRSNDNHYYGQLPSMSLDNLLSSVCS